MSVCNVYVGIGPGWTSGTASVAVHSVRPGRGWQRAGGIRRGPTLPQGHQRQCARLYAVNLRRQRNREQSQRQGNLQDNDVQLSYFIYPEKRGLHLECHLSAVSQLGFSQNFVLR